MEDIPDAFDSREVLIGRSQPCPFFVVKGMDQVLPYCVINFTRGLAPNRPAPSISPLPAASRSGVNSSLPSSTTRSQNTYMRLQNIQTQLQNSMISTSGPPVAQSSSGSTFAGASAVNWNLPMNQLPYGARHFFGLSAGSSQWPPVSVCFLPGKHCVIFTSAAGGMTVSLKDSPTTTMMRNMETNAGKLVGLQIYVITKLRSRPDLSANVRLRTIFRWLQQSDAICCAAEAIAEVEDELLTYI